MSPFGDKCEYGDLAACVTLNQDKDNPEAFCTFLQNATEEG